MIGRVCLCVLASFAACATPAPGTTGSLAKLQRALSERAAAFEGEVGIYARDLRDGRSVELRADEVFPTASLIKVPILIGVFDALERREFELRTPLTWDASRANDSHDILARFEDGAEVEPAELVTLMCTFSDNSASLWLQELAGGGSKINAWLAAHGFEKTRVNSRTEGRDSERREFGWGQTTPREMAQLLVTIRERRAVSASASERMERSLSRSAWDEEALSSIPPSVHAMSKQGAVSRSRSEVLLVDGPSAPYVLCVITRNQADESYAHDNAGFQLLRDVSALVYEEFGR